MVQRMHINMDTFRKSLYWKKNARLWIEHEWKKLKACRSKTPLFYSSTLRTQTLTFPTHSCMSTFAKPLYQTQIPSQIFLNFTQLNSIFSTWHYSSYVSQYYQVTSSTSYLFHFTYPHPSYPPLITCPRCMLHHSYSHLSHPLNSLTHLNGLPIANP